MTLYDYQLDAVKKMKNGCILCGGVGSGKSLTALAYYYLQNGGSVSWLSGLEPHMPMDDPPMDLYIITTARKRDTLEWEKELCHFLMSTHSEENLYKNTIIVDSWNNIVHYKDVKDAFFIFDEQRVIGSGVWVKTFLKICKSNSWILLSATPGDTWTDYIPVFIANDFYRNRSEFLDEHVVYSRFSKFPKIDKYINTGRLIRLRDSILVDMDFHRDTISHHENIVVEYDSEKYKRIMRDRWDIYGDKPIESAGELCYALRKVVNSDETRSISVLEIMKKHPRAIIFYNFDYELKLLLNLAMINSVEVAQWNGHKHQPIPETEKWMYLVQYNAGNEGWNCIKTDTIIFYSQNYSYKVMIQAAGRIDRLNTPYKDLYYYHLKSRASIDLAIARALNEKRKFNERSWAKEY